MKRKWIALSVALMILLSLVQPSVVQAETDELNIIGVGVETRNLALEATAYGTGACNVNEQAHHAIDGKRDTKWCDNSERDERWLMLDLGGVYTINQWVVQNNAIAEKNNSPFWNTKNFRLQKSEDGKRWEDVDVVQNNSQTIVDRYVDSFDAQYVRIYITESAHKGNIARIAEFEVYGVEQGEIPAYPAINLLPIDYVDPFINTLGDNGQTNPGPRTPFGLAAPGPDSDGGAFSGYFYEDRALKGFSNTRFSGVGCSGAGGNVLMMPTLKSFTTSSSQYKEAYQKINESASAGYYSVVLDSGVQVELTASDNVGFHRYTFPNDAAAGSVLIDLSTSYAGVNNATLKVEGENEITGMVEARNVCGHGYYKLYYSVQFDQNFTSYRSWAGSDNGEVAERSGANSGVWLNFDTAANKTIEAKIALSTISVEQAQKEQGASGVGQNFDEQYTSIYQLWSDTLNKVEIIDSDEENKRIFYTQLYHAMQHPNNATSSEGEFRAARDENTIRNTSEIGEDFVYYSGWTSWDDFRKYPLYSILAPQQFENMALSLVDVYKTRGSYTQWGQGYWPTPTVRNEFNSAIILDAIAKGLELSEDELNVVLKGMAEDVDNYAIDDNSISGKLEKASNAYYPMKVAEMLGDTSMYNKYLQISQSYKSQWNGSQVDEDGVERGFFTPNGNTIDPSGIKAVGRYAYQGNLWTYRWTVQHDIPGMIELMGGKREAAKDLQHFFAIDEYVAVNEPDLHAPFLFNYMGMPYLTQYYAREYTTEVVTQKYNNHGLNEYPVKTRVYRADPEGYLFSADDDAGALSSWFVFSAMGLYPANPGDPYYLIGSPIFSELKLHLDNGETFTIKAQGVSSDNRFIQSAQLNGQSFDQAWINHEDIMAGGSLEFVMGSEPNYSWGASAEAAPPATDFGKALAERTTTEELIAKNAVWSYLDEGRYAGDGWTSLEFDDSTWKSGQATLGYDNGNNVDTIVGYGPDSGNKYPTTYFRHIFEVDNLEEIVKLNASLLRDDGAIVYLNGQEIIRTNMPDGIVGYNTYANGTVNNERNWLSYTIDPELLVEGDNVIAAEVHQVNATSSDIAFGFALDREINLSVPAAPTAPIVDDEGNTFGWTNVEGFDAPADYEYSVDGGANWQQAESNPQIVGAFDFDAGMVQVRVKADLSNKQAAGESLQSDQAFTRGEAWNVYELEVEQTSDPNLTVTAKGTLVGDYRDDAYVVFQLMDDGDQAWLSSAQPVDNGNFEVSQIFNVNGDGYEVNVYVVDAFNGNINHSLWLAEPVAPKPEVPGDESENPGTEPQPEPLPIPVKPIEPIDPFDPNQEEEWPIDPEIPSDGRLTVEFEEFDEWSTANHSNGSPLKIEENSSTQRTVVANTYPDAWLAYEQVDFGEEGMNRVTIEYDAPTGRAPEDIALEIRLGSKDGELVGIAELPRTGSGWGQYTTYEQLLNTTIKGKQDLYIVMKGSTSDAHPYIGNFDRLTFDYIKIRSDYAKLELEKYDSWSTELNAGNSQPLKTEGGKSGQQVANTFDGAWLLYENMDFGISGVNVVGIEYAGNSRNTAADAYVEIRLGGVNGTLVGTVGTPPTADGWGTYAVAEAELTQPLTGMQDLYFVLRGTTGAGISYIGNFDNASFSTRNLSEPPVDPEEPQEPEEPTGRTDYAMLELEAYDKWSTELNAGNNNTPLKTESGKSGEKVANTFDGAWLMFKDMNFGDAGVNRVAIEYDGHSGRVAADARVEIRLGGVEGTLVGTVNTPPTANSWGTYAVVEAELTQTLTGKQDLYFVLRGTTGGGLIYIGNFDNARFSLASE